MPMFKNSDCKCLPGSAGGVVRSRQPIDDVVLPKDSFAKEYSVIDTFHNKLLRNGQDRNSYVGPVGTWQSNSHGVGDSHVVDCPISRHLTVPSVVCRGPENRSQSMSAHGDAIVKAGSLSVTNLSLQNLRTLHIYSDVSTSNGEKDVIVDKDPTSSSIELRLGQPNQQSQPSGHQVMSGVGPQPYNTRAEWQRQFSEEQMTHYVNRCGEERHYRHLPIAAGLSNPDTRDYNQLNHRQSTVSNTCHTAKQEKLKSNLAGTSVASLFEHLNAPPQESLYSKTANNVASINEHIMPERLHWESYTTKCNPVNVLWNGGGGLEREWTASDFGCFRSTDKGKVVGCLTGNGYPETYYGSKMQKWIENPSFLAGMVSAKNYSGFSALHDKDHPHHLSSIQSGATNSVNFSNYLEKVTCNGNGLKDHAFLRTMELPSGIAKSLTPQAVPSGVKASTSTSIPVPAPSLSQQDTISVSPCLLDDNLRLLALRQILELSKQQHALSSHGESLEQGRCDDKVRYSLVEPSRSGELRQGLDLTSRQYESKIPLESIQCGSVNKTDNDKFMPVTGMKDWRDLSMLRKRKPLQQIGTHWQVSHNALQNEQPSLRLGGSETNIKHSNELELASCCEGTLHAQGNCSCAHHKKYLRGKCTLIGGNPPISFREQMGDVNGKPSTLIAPNNHCVPKGSTVSFDQYGKLQGQVSKNVSCHTAQWKDVPSKTKRLCEVVCLKQSSDISDRREHEVGQIGDTFTKCSNVASCIGPVHAEASLKEQEISNISSGCSTPVVTQVSIEVNNVDSSAFVDHPGYVNDLIIDEGSGIDKCWSSDDALESDKSADFPGSACMTTVRKDGSVQVTNNHSSRSLLEEVKLMDSLAWKRGRNQIHAGTTVQEKSNDFQTYEMGLKTGKRKREIKLKMLDAPLGNMGPAAHNKYPECGEIAEWPRFSKDLEMGLETSHSSGGLPSKPSSKRAKCHPTLPLPKALSRKRDLREANDYEEELINNAIFCKRVEISGRKKIKGSGTADECGHFQTQEGTHPGDGEEDSYNLINGIKSCSSQHVTSGNSMARPVVCGKYGEISNGITGDVPVTVKIVSLENVLKTARRCTLPKTCKSRKNLSKDLKRTNFSWRKTCFDEGSNLKRKSENHEPSGDEVRNLHNFVKVEGASTGGDKGSANEFLMLDNEKSNEISKASWVLETETQAQSKAKFKEIRSRSLYELSSKGKTPSCEMVSHMENCGSKTGVKKILHNSEDSRSHTSGSYKADTKRYVQKQRKTATVDAFCCVCGSSSQDEVNCLLECGRCFIRVHQACYGVSKVPKGTWCCRPCRTCSKNIVCVLCGYGGGAMSRALRCRTIMKTFMKAWNSETDCSQKNTNLSTETLQDEVSMLHSTGSVMENSSDLISRPESAEPSTSALQNTETPHKLDTSQSSLASAKNLKANNSITAGMLDSTVKQWVHMVCGLWTPETRCPNVNTMSAFDVSGVSCSRANMVCSLCNRPGGSCIQCRVVNCSTLFHPWCAHQKGLLQSEIEGVDNENVGFYGRCLLHATYQVNESACDATDVITVCTGEKKASCARTEGYKGRKRDGFWHNLHGQSRENAGSLVPQEQLNAWIHINGQKPCAQGFLKPPISDSEYACRKEYTRYKQTKGWKRLVVYKSGIHALGLYTSRFISRSEMVVEYVGEIVGLRVADKREIDYQSGRKLQYKSACYFFRIDKEHIIDATRMGGIARFVNHSCLPNCVAKVISVRNEKKVVFFAERDIYPGEEITYDYHFNHEDEGKKIPCFCNSKNCRRYLN